MEKLVAVKITGETAEDVANIEKFVRLVANFSNKKELARASKKVVNNPTLLNMAIKFL